MAKSAIVDTVVLRYFLLARRPDLLLRLLGNPVHVPRVVFDPNEGGVVEDAMSEIGRSIRFQERVAQDHGRLKEARDQAVRKASRLRAVHDMYAKGEIGLVDLTDDELRLFAELTSADGARKVGLKLPLGAGEAACIAVAVTRGWILATDDQDALRALQRLSPGHPYERIRRLLRRAAEDELITRTEANAIHAEMRALGFRDTTAPFEGPPR